VERPFFFIPTIENDQTFKKYLKVFILYYFSAKLKLKSMKKLLLTIVLAGATMWSQAQVIFSVESPASISGNYDFSWSDPAGGWGSPDFNIPGEFVQGDLMIVDDGSTGTNAQGNPISAEGCNPLINDLTGKIAVIYRNTCEFGAKALNAELAGAIGAIIINRDPEVIEMGAGVNGATCTIPVAFVSSITGQLITDAMALGTVNVFFGNKTGLFADDAGLTRGTTLISKSYGTPALVAQNATEFNFELGSRVYNYGTNPQVGASLTATIDGPSGNVYDETVGPLTIASGDSVDVFPGGAFEFPTFSLASYPAGRYTVTYTVTLGNADEYAGDNSVSSDFVINNEVFSIGELDETTNLPISNNAYRPSDNTSTFSECIVFSHPNADRLAVDGLYFSAQGTNVDLSGEEMALNLYRWDDAFVDLEDPNLGFNSLTPVTFGYYYYPSDLQGETVYGQFNDQVVLQNNTRYLACVQTVNLEVFLGFDTETNYLWNEAYYLQPLTIIENDGTYFASGFGADVVPALGLRVFDQNQVGIEEAKKIEGAVYPNPATEVVTVSVNGEGNAVLNVTDLAGRTVSTATVALVNGAAELNVSDLNSGAYIINVSLEDGRTTQFNIVKK
jgi:hypothetical protein